MRCVFVSDLHGRFERYSRLYDIIRSEAPDAVFLGGDLITVAAAPDTRIDGSEDTGVLADLADLKRTMGGAYPRVFLIMGNDDPRSLESEAARGAAEGLWDYVHNTRAALQKYTVLGYACVPPTPYLLKDWERYDVSRYVPPGGVSPEEGYRTVAPDLNGVRYGTIAGDLDKLAGAENLERAICLFHSPPYETNLDRADRDGQMIDYVPLDLFVGSIAIRRFIEERQPLLTLHGHVHESTRLTGGWRDRIGRTHMFNAAHDGPELAVIRFDPEDLDNAERELV